MNNIDFSKFNKIQFISDIHGRWNDLQYILDYQSDEYTLNFLLGDIGFGFKSKNGLYLNNGLFPKNNNVAILRGNHDLEAEMLKCDRYLGRWGYIDEFDLFYFGGAFSPDLFYRTKNIDWWITEENTWEDFEEALKVYQEVKPSRMASHDGCWTLTDNLGYRNNSRTQEMLEEFRKYHKPKHHWVAHYHIDYQKEIDGTTFYIMPELGTYTIDTK